MRTRTKLLRDHIPAGVLVPPILATLGNYDGIHRGHQRILERMREERDRLGGGTLVTISFYPHPAVVLKKLPTSPWITSPRQKLDILTRFECDVLFLLKFTTDFSRLHADEFVQRYLIDLLNVDHLFVGEDAAIGRGREGGADFIVSAMKARGKQGEIVPFVLENGEKIASKTIRGEIRAGNMEQVQALLGRPYSIEGCVTRGAARGREMKVPTANITYAKRELPPQGVYATWTRVDREIVPSVTNVGVKPTFGENQLTIETHLLERGRDIYGKRIEVFFVNRLRAEMKFDDVEKLKEQIHKDITRAQELLTPTAKEHVLRWLHHDR